MFRQDTPNRTGNKDTSDLFSRLGLPTIEVRKLCWDFIKTHYVNEDIKIDDHDIREAPNQGFCSYTLLLDPRPETIVQFRSLTHKLDLNIINAAREIYGELVAVTELIGCLRTRKTRRISTSSPISMNSLQNHDSDPSLLVYSLSRIQGMSLAEFYTTPQCPYHHRESLVKSFAGIISQGLLAWSGPRHSHPAPKGRVGSTIRRRLEMMQRELPIRFRPTVDIILDALPKIEALPWVLTHGDLVPSNVIIDFCTSKQHKYSSCNNCSSSQQPTSKNNNDPAQQQQEQQEQLPFIRGLIDWAEAEYLPFGVGIYGLEEFLGIQLPIIPVNETDPTTSKLDTDGKKYPPPESKFTYFSEAETLRSLFWTELGTWIRGAELNSKPFLHTTTTDNNLFETVRLARTLGILLWHGIAFDDGRLDRVICEGIDDEEIQRLDIHLDLHERQDRLKN